MNSWKVIPGHGRHGAHELWFRDRLVGAIAGACGLLAIVDLARALNVRAEIFQPAGNPSREPIQRNEKAPRT